MAVRERRLNGMPTGLHNGGPVVRQQKRGLIQRARAWVDSKIFAYNVTLGLYMLDWWERVLFNALALLLLWFISYNTSELLIDYAKEASRAWREWSPPGEENRYEIR